jgi:hypothetical protein
MAARPKERNGGGRSGWQGVARSGFVRKCSGETRSGWQDMAWTGPATRGRLVRRGSARTEAVRLGHSWLVRLGKARSGLATRGLAGRHGATWTTSERRRSADMERRGLPGETRSGWQGAAWTLIERRGSAGKATLGRALRVLARQAWRRKDGHRLFRLGWRGSALLRSDGTVLEWLGGRATLRLAWIVMTRWA